MLPTLQLWPGTTSHSLYSRALLHFVCCSLFLQPPFTILLQLKCQTICWPSLFCRNFLKQFRLRLWFTRTSWFACMFLRKQESALLPIGSTIYKVIKPTYYFGSPSTKVLQPGHVTITRTREYLSQVLVRYRVEYSYSRVRVLVITSTTTSTSISSGDLKTRRKYSRVLVINKKIYSGLIWTVFELVNVGGAEIEIAN